MLMSLMTVKIPRILLCSKIYSGFPELLSHSLNIFIDGEYKARRDYLAKLEL